MKQSLIDKALAHHFIEWKSDCINYLLVLTGTDGVQNHRDILQVQFKKYWEDDIEPMDAATLIIEEWYPNG